MAVAEHVNSMVALAEGFRLRPDVPRLSEGPATELVPPLDEAAPGLAADTLDEIRSWAKSTLGIEHVPAFWRVLARHPRFLASTWAKNGLVLGAAGLHEATKACAALAVAMNAHSAYFTSYLNPWVRHAVALADNCLAQPAHTVVH